MPARARTALVGAGISSALLALIWLLAFHTGFGEHVDLSIFNGFVGLQRPRVNRLANFVASLCDPKPFVVLGAGVVAVTLARRRPRIALAVVVVLVGANVTARLINRLLAVPPGPPDGPSWPSGHATAAMSLALGLVLAAPARRRPVAAALGALFAVGVSYSMLTLGYHYPSDVLGGFLVAVTWTELAVAGMEIADIRRARQPEPSARHPVPLRTAPAAPAAAVAGAAVVAGLVILVRPQDGPYPSRPHQVMAYAGGHSAFIAGAAAIAALAFSLSTTVMLSLRR
jgi:membrane-associated phospholipid phosphatase